MLRHTYRESEASSNESPASNPRGSEEVRRAAYAGNQIPDIITCQKTMLID